MREKLAKGMKLILFNLFIFTALLGLAELTSRVFHKVDFPDPLIMDAVVGWPDMKEYDPLLFWKLKPNIMKDGNALTNSFGLRGPDIPGEKADDEFRILSLGESTTFAFRQPYERTYTSLLENIGPIDNRKVRAINAGIPAYTIVQGATYLKHRGLKFAPDLVVIYFGWNDFLPTAIRETRDAGASKATVGKTDLELLERHAALSYRVFHFLTKHSNLARSIAFRKKFTKDDIITGVSDPRVPESDRELMLKEISTLCQNKGIELIVVIPWYKQFNNHIPLLRKFASNRNVHVVDLPHNTKHLNNRLNEYFDDNIHPNAKGHALIAENIQEKIREIWAE